jgi:hypothetical protein
LAGRVTAGLTDHERSCPVGGDPMAGRIPAWKTGPRRFTGQGEKAGIIARMVRPERSGRVSPDRCSVEPAGESPATVSAGAPCSRPRSGGEIPTAERGVKSPRVSRRRGVGGEQIRGPRMKRTLQPRDIRAERRDGRAGHVAAKATDSARGPEWALDVLGVWRRARGEGSTGNRRDPPRQPTSGEGDAYKPKAKWRRAGRESEGLIVPMKAVKAAGGKGPCLDHAWVWG